MTKILGLAVVRTGPELNEPIPVSVANDLTSFGFFQRQVRMEMRKGKKKSRKFNKPFSRRSCVPSELE